MGDFVGVETNDAWVRCISCAEEEYGTEVVQVIQETGQQGRFFKAICIGSQNYDRRECLGCGVPMNGERH